MILSRKSSKFHFATLFEMKICTYAITLDSFATGTSQGADGRHVVGTTRIAVGTLLLA
jgi:hypothetical protein